MPFFALREAHEYEYVGDPEHVHTTEEAIGRFEQRLKHRLIVTDGPGDFHLLSFDANVVGFTGDRPAVCELLRGERIE